MSGNVLTVSGLHAGYGDEDILHDVAIDVPRGAIVAIIGPNGSGKSTLLKAIYGLVRTRKGTVVLHAADGATSDLVNMRPSAITALVIGALVVVGGIGLIACLVAMARSNY